MRCLLLDRRSLVAFSTLALTVLFGCGGTSTTLPSTVLVELPDGTTTEAQQGAGAATLANSAWDFVRTGAAGQGTTFVRIRFNENGGLDRFEQSTIASEVFGDEIVFDGQLHPTNQQGIEYAATTYGAGTSDGTGFAFEGRLTASLGGLTIGTGTAGAGGTFDAADPDVMTGTFSYSTSLTVPIDIPGAEQADAFTFRATRVVE